MKLPYTTASRAALAAFLIAGLMACSSTPPKNEQDPWEDTNRDIQSFNDDLDDYVMKPVAEGYRYVMPEVADKGVTNFFSNLDDIGVFVNDLLQAKWVQGGQDMTRFVVNTVAGLGGFIDVASELDLPKHKEDFDQTLGYWGVPAGPYMVLPFFGPGSPRHVFGRIGDSATNPINYVAPVIGSTLSGMLSATDQRADYLSASKIADQAATDRYEFIRNAYLQERAYQINDGDVPLDPDIEREMDELDKELEAKPANPAPRKDSVEEADAESPAK